MRGKLKLNAIVYITVLAIVLFYVFIDLLGIKLRWR